MKVLLFLLLFSCVNIDRDKPVDKSRLTGSDYRLFQNTPAWELAKAVQDKDEKKIEAILQDNPKLIDYQESTYGNTLLMLTVMNQQMTSFTIVLENKADIHIHNTYDGASALIKACSFEYYNSKFAEILLQHGANVNDIEVGTRRQGNSTRFTPLMAASRAGNIDLVELLVKSGADINYQNEFKQSALSRSVMQDKYKVALLLLENGADYKKPIFYRRGNNNADYNPAEDIPMYLVDLLREDFFDLDSEEYEYKMKIVDFLKSKGIDYRATPVPESIKKKAQEYYPNSWQKYIEKY